MNDSQPREALPDEILRSTLKVEVQGEIRMLADKHGGNAWRLLGEAINRASDHVLAAVREVLAEDEVRRAEDFELQAHKALKRAQKLRNGET